MTTSLLRLSAAVALALGLAACAGEPEPGSLLEGAGSGAALEGVGSGAGAGYGAGYGDASDPASPAYFEQVVGDRVFFATDSSALDGSAQETLARQAVWLQQNPGVPVTIEGHADERGTREYNLALGARRAAAARDYLLARGVDGGRLNTVTYGKERPVAVCSNESCWAENRRAVSVLAGVPMS